VRGADSPALGDSSSLPTPPAEFSDSWSLADETADSSDDVEPPPPLADFSAGVGLEFCVDFLPPFSSTCVVAFFSLTDTAADDAAALGLEAAGTSGTVFSAAPPEVGSASMSSGSPTAYGFLSASTADASLALLTAGFGACVGVGVGFGVDEAATRCAGKGEIAGDGGDSTAAALTPTAEPMPPPPLSRDEGEGCLAGGCTCVTGVAEVACASGFTAD